MVPCKSRPCFSGFILCSCIPNNNKKKRETIIMRRIQPSRYTKYALSYSTKQLISSVSIGAISASRRYYYSYPKELYSPWTFWNIRSLTDGVWHEQWLLDHRSAFDHDTLCCVYPSCLLQYRTVTFILRPIVVSAYYCSLFVPSTFIFRLNLPPKAFNSRNVT